MLLRKLAEHAGRLDLPPPMYLATPVKWLIEIDRSGRLLGPGFTRTASEGRGTPRFAPHRQRSSGVAAKLLADNGEYVLGLAREDSRPERVAQCHAAFVDEVRRCLAATGEPAVAAVLAFLEALVGAPPEVPAELDAGEVVTFSVDGGLPIDLPAVQSYWARTTATGEDGEGGEPGDPMTCLVCGVTKSVEKRLSFKVKGIPGGQTSGLALISANAPAFESYGLEASLIAPTCRDCGERFTKALNHLLADDRGHVNVGPLAYVFWTREELPFSIVDLLTHPDPGQVRELLRAATTGRRSAVELEAAPFYAAAFSASGARVVVRDWLETTIPAVQEHLARFFALQQIIDPFAEGEPKPFGIFALARSTVFDAKKLPAHVPQRLLSFALRGGGLPSALLDQAVRRNRAEQGVTRPRAALIKLVLLSQLDRPEEGLMVQLDPANTSSAYVCGRLLAVLEQVQRAAIPGAKATITDRFYGTASAAPASVFGVLLRNAQAHLGKLRKEREGTWKALSRRLEEVISRLSPVDGWPRTLTLRDQALFSLGYYHEKADSRAAAIARVAERRAEAADADLEADDTERETD